MRAISSSSSTHIDSSSFIVFTEQLPANHFCYTVFLEGGMRIVLVLILIPEIRLCHLPFQPRQPGWWAKSLLCLADVYILPFGLSSLGFPKSIIRFLSAVKRTLVPDNRARAITC